MVERKRAVDKPGFQTVQATPEPVPGVGESIGSFLLPVNIPIIRAGQKVCIAMAFNRPAVYPAQQCLQRCGIRLVIVNTFQGHGGVHADVHKLISECDQCCSFFVVQP